MCCREHLAGVPGDPCLAQEAGTVKYGGKRGRGGDGGSAPRHGERSCPPGPAMSSTGQVRGFVLPWMAALGGLHEAVPSGCWRDLFQSISVGCSGDLAAARSVPRKQGAAFNPSIRLRNGQRCSSSLELQRTGWLRGCQAWTSLASDARAWDGMGWDGVAWHGVARDGMAWDGMG